jgi:hypothetical protein
MMERYSGDQTGSTSVSETCPCFPASSCAIHSPIYKPETRKHIYAEVVRHASCVPQTEALYRVSVLRSHQKRGPPLPLA